jgi:hypothetical protein
LLLGVHGLFEPYRLFAAGAYTGRILDDFGLPAPLISFLFLGVAFLMILPWLLRRFRDRPPLKVSMPPFPQWRWGLAGLILLVVFWGYFIRPHFSPTADGDNLLSLGWILTPYGLLAAVLGLCLAVLKLQDARGIYLLLSVLPMSFLSVLSWKLTPIHFWATKRFQVVTIWGCILLIVYLYDKALDRGVTSRLLFAGLILVMILMPMRKAVPWLDRPDYRGYPDFIESLAGNFGKRDVILCRTDRTAAPLHFLHGLESLVFRPGREEDWERASYRSRKWIKEGRRVFFLGGENVRKLPPPSWRLLEDVPLETSHMERRKGGLPQRRIEVDLALPLYRYEPFPSSGPSGEADP